MSWQEVQESPEEVMVKAALQGKSHLCFPFLEIVWPQPQFPLSCVCDRFYYSQDQST